MELMGNIFRYDYACPKCKHLGHLDITPRQVNLVPEVEVSLTYCARCGDNLTDYLRTAINAGLFLVVEALRNNGVSYTYRPLFQTFFDNWCAIKAMLDSDCLEYRERSMLIDLFGFETGKRLTYKSLGDLYSLTHAGVYKIIQRAYTKLVSCHKMDMLKYLSPCARISKHDVFVDSGSILNQKVLV